MASPLSAEIFGKINVIMNVQWSVVQSLCSCVQIEVSSSTLKNFRESCFKTVYVKLKRRKEGCCVSVSYVCEDCVKTV